jgi:hypothetical protein
VNQLSVSRETRDDEIPVWPCWLALFLGAIGGLLLWFVIVVAVWSTMMVP